MELLGDGRFPQSLGPGESQFSQSSVLSVAASFVFVFGSLYLLTSTASWSPQSGVETEASARSSARAETKTPVEVAWAPSQALSGAVPSPAQGLDEAAAAVAQPASQEPVEPADPSSSSPAQPQDPAVTSNAAALPEASAPEAETIVPESMASEASAAPEIIAVTHVVPETAATDPIGELIARSPPSTLSTRTIQEDIAEDDVPNRAVMADGAPSEPTGSTAARHDVPAPSNPKQEPQAARQTADTAPPSRPEASKQTQARPASAQRVQAQPRNDFGFRPPMALGPADTPAPAPAAKPKPGGFRLPMALAPATKPVAALPAKPRQSRAAYSRKVWAALARSKPRAGQRGSATVTFTVGAGGALGGARISRSSGNARIDQLALTTVRRAAPFPAPPSGGSSFSIRIDFN